MNPVHVATGIIENGGGEILIAQRPPGSQLEGQWEFPGGKLEAGETSEQALHRELKEELELDIRVLAPLGEFPFTYPWGSIVLHVFRVSALNTPRPTESVHVFRWVTPAALDVSLLAEADVEPFYFYQRTLTPT